MNDKQIGATVLEAIRESDEPLSLDDLERLTGFDRRQVRNALTRLLEQRLVWRVRRGTYSASRVMQPGTLFEYVGMVGETMIVREVEGDQLWKLEPASI